MKKPKRNVEETRRLIRNFKFKPIYDGLTQIFMKRENLSPEKAAIKAFSQMRVMLLTTKALRRMRLSILEFRRKQEGPSNKLGAAIQKLQRERGRRRRAR
ncbi:MAG: hypothetical protein NTW59_05345 [Candidatus Diapherotrites archaeon]|nr:hypothetical protein [Candidatus Diapherotrites archaeon]